MLRRTCSPLAYYKDDIEMKRHPAVVIPIIDGSV